MNNKKIIEKLPLIKKSPLFKGLTDSEIEDFINCVDCQYKSYDKGELIVSARDTATKFGILLSGQIIYFREDFWGNRNILIGINAPNSFGEVFAYTDENIFIMNVVATEKTQILFVNCQKINSCCNHCERPYHHLVMQNMLRVIAQKYIAIMEKTEHIMKRSLREKLMSYLSSQAKLAKNCSFEIPFSRQEMADYLSVDRSALSAELSRMKKEGILNYHKNCFKLLNNESKINNI